MSGSDQSKQALNVVLYWHMHQPDYRDQRNGEYHLPWTYLHTIKDYIDMVAHLENNAHAKAIVNFAPILLEQIDDYATQLRDYLNHGKALRDPLLSALAEPVLFLDHDKRLNLVKSCLRANKKRLIDRFDVYSTLADMAELAIERPDKLVYYSDQYFVDIVVWYHLVWIGETVRKTDQRVKSLMKQARNFSISDRHLLIEIIGELISGVIGRYRKLAESGQIELSTTPYAHPILPLLIDFKSAEQALPNTTLPLSPTYPGGLERCRWHMEKGISVFKKHFGILPAGCWPSEGGISTETIELIADVGLKWLASGESVLRNTLEKNNVNQDCCIHDVYSFRDKEIACFFRDDGLSDLIGFKYADWHADDAVANLIHHLESIAKICSDNANAVVSIILDGENAWEYYPENGYYFLSALYQKLSQHDGIRLTTYTEYLTSKKESICLQEIVAGSWVYGTFSTWIGEKDKNRAWDMLVEAKKAVDKALSEGRLNEVQLQSALMQLATCESSDWFWWVGAYNPSESVATFDEQYRIHLCNLYQLIDVEPPEYLARAFSFGSTSTSISGTMLPGKQH